MCEELEGPAPWSLPIRGFEVLSVTFGPPVTLAVYAEGAGCKIAFGQPFELIAYDGAKHVLDPDSWEVNGPGRVMLVAPPEGGDPRWITSKTRSYVWKPGGRGSSA